MNTSIGKTATRPPSTGSTVTVKYQRGYLLLPVAVTLSLVATVAYLISQEGALESNMAKGEAQTTQLQYLTEAGLNHALWRTERNYCEGSFSIPATAMGADNYSATINGTGSTTKYSLPISQDAWIRNDNPTTNNGSANTQHIRNEAGNIEQALYQFDLSSLNAGARINSAFAWFYIDQQHPEGAISAHRINADWVDSTVTWDNFGAAFDSATLAMVPPQDQSDSWVAFNITSQVQAWVNGETNNGIALASNAEGVHARYMSLEGTAGQQPRLEVVAGTAPATALDIEATGTLANGISKSLSRMQVPDYQGPSEAFVQFSASNGEDAHIDNFYDTRNFGGTDYLQVSSDKGWTTRSLLRFEPGAVPAGARIMSAQLQLKLKSVKTGGTISVHRPQRNWVEGTKVGGGVADGANWFTYDDSNSWSSAGGDYDEAVSSTSISSGDSWVAFDITLLVRDWAAGKPNNGVMLVGNSPLDEAEFESRQTEFTEDAPRVTIRYSCPCNSVCSVPQGSGNILMVVGIDSPAPGPNDTLKKALFESWGYNVTLLNDNAGQTSFDNAFTVNDMVFISETISSNDLANKVANAPIGVVSEQGTQNDNLGFESANSNNWPVGDTLTITDNSHEITQSFPSGPLTLYEHAMGGLAIDNTPSPDLQPLADWGTATGLAVLETGAAMANGGNTTSRRVMLPFGRDSNMDWNKINNNGHILLQRAIEWAGSTPVAEAATQLLFVSAGSLVFNMGTGEWFITPTAQEQLRINLIESWNYQVNLIHETAIQSEIDQAVTDNDVAYVSSEVDPTQLDLKLRNAAIGLVNEEIELAAEFGFAADRIFKTNSSISILNNSHYITSPFSLGLLSLYASDQPVHMLNATYSSDLTELAESENVGGGYKPSLALLDTGNIMEYGGNTAGRRVQLPWGQDSFDFSALNSDGQLLMKRAIEWAEGAEAPAPSATRVLYMVKDPTALSTQETARENLMINDWNFEVTLIDDDTTSFDLYAQMGLNDVAYISQEILADTLGGKLADATIGVVNENREYIDDFGFATSASAGGGLPTLTVDPDHYITSVFSTTTVVPYTINEWYQITSLPVATGAQAPGTWNESPWTGRPALMTAETGADLINGRTAAGRRVQIPMGAGQGLAPVDINGLSDDGRTIIQRSILWAAGEGAPPLPPEPPTSGPLTLNPVADTYIRESSSNNFGTTHLRIGRINGNGKNFRSILNFDLSSVPEGALINSATLRLFATGQSGSAAYSINAHRITQDWTESGASWTETDGSTLWSGGPGGSYDSTVIDTVPAGATGWYEWDLTPLVQEWVDGISTNQGIELIHTAVAKGNYLDFDSKELTDKPELIIDYTPL